MQEISLAIVGAENAAKYLDTLLTAKGHSGDLVNKAISELTGKLKRFDTRDNQNFINAGQGFFAVLTLLSTIALYNGIDSITPDSGTLIDGIQGYGEIIQNWITDPDDHRASEIMRTRAIVAPIFPVVFGAITAGLHFIRTNDEARHKDMEPTSE